MTLWISNGVRRRFLWHCAPSSDLAKISSELSQNFGRFVHYLPTPGLEHQSCHSFPSDINFRNNVLATSLGLTATGVVVEKEGQIRTLGPSP
uniref:Uncharacterized protein n=1 Tax=Rhipicephalus zambeziensis TaxID=60191 RepID=A0A224YGJ4_9ACAR